MCVCSRRKDPLSPVPENHPGFPMASSTSDVGVVVSGRGLTSLAMQTALMNRSMDQVCGGREREKWEERAIGTNERWKRRWR